jgi:hypothetical protein
MVVALESVYFDYTCPYSRRLSELLDALRITEVRWRPFVLAEQNRGNEGTLVWERPDALARPALALHESVAAGGDGDVFRREAFTAFGERHVTLEELQAMAQHAGAPIDEASLQQGLTRVAASHQVAHAAGVFGTPTVRTTQKQLGYVKLTSLPAESGTREHVLETALTLINDIPELAEIKRPTV